MFVKRNNQVPWLHFSVIFMKILHCSPHLLWLLQFIFSKQSVQRHFSISYLCIQKWDCGYYFQLMVWFHFVWQLFKVRFSFSSKVEIKYLSSVIRRTFPAFYSSVCKAECCTWMQISGESSPFLAFSTEVVIEATLVLTLPVGLHGPCAALSRSWHNHRLAV